MKSVYTNRPLNCRKSDNPVRAPLGVLAIMSMVIVSMFAVRLIYAPPSSSEADASPVSAKETEAAQPVIAGEESRSADEKTEDEKFEFSSFASKAVYPIKNGEITSGFGERTSPVTGNNEFHYGVDIVGGRSVMAYRGGSVKSVGLDESYGKFVVINHGDGTESLYAHCDKIYVRRGDEVYAGQRIALAGDSGDATGVHLHFEVRKDGVCTDPVDYLRAE